MSPDPNAGPNAGPNLGPSEPRAKKEMPVWGGVVVGLVVACAVVGLVLRSRATHTVEPRARAASPASTGALANASESATSSALPASSSKPAERVVVYPVVHPAPSSSKGKTAEREAVDALHSGEPRRAAELYGELAKAHPDNAAIVDAARLLGDGTYTR